MLIINTIIDSIRFSYIIFCMRGKGIDHVKYTAPGDRGGGSHRKFFNFKLSDIASGGFWGPRRLVAEMLLQVEKNLD